MRKTFTTLACAMMLGASVSAYAQSATLDEEFTLSTNTYIEFTAPQTGTLTAVLNPGLFSMLGEPTSILKSSQSENADVDMTIVTDNGTYATVVSWEVTEQQTYYFYANLTQGEQTVLLTMGDVSDLPQPEGDVTLGEQFSVNVGEYKKYYNEEAGTLTATLTEPQKNSTEKATLLYTSWSNTIDPDTGTGGTGMVAFETNMTPGGTTYTQQIWEVRANTMYYICANSTTGDVTLTLSFEPFVDEESTPLEWNTPQSLESGESYYIMGKGTTAHIETTNKTDLTQGGTLLIYEAGNESQVVALTPVETPEGYYYYNIAGLENGVKYIVEYNSFNSINLTFVEGLYESTVVKEPTVIDLGDYSLNAKEVYSLTLSQNGTLVITTEQCPATDITDAILFVDAECTTPLEGVTVEADEDGNYKCLVDVEAGETVYIYFTSPNYIVASLNIELPSFYISGVFNNNNPGDDNQWMLTPDILEPSVYSGMFYIAKGEFQFNFFFGNSYLVPANEDLEASSESVILDFNNFNAISYLAEGEADVFWVNENWPGGTLYVTVDLNENMVSFQYEEEVVDVWYLRGTFNNYNPSDDAVWALQPSEDVEEEGVYAGIFEIEAGEFSFNLQNPAGTVFIPSEGESVEVVFDENVYTGSLVYASDAAEETYSWVNAEWEGGMISVTLNTTDMSLVIENLSETDAVESLVKVQEDGVVYNLQGVRVSNPAKGGIYIINGKKVLVK